MNYIVIFLALLLIVLLVYKLWAPTFKAPKRKVSENEARLYFFYTEWCGFSQKAMPEWKKLEDTLNSTPIFGTTRVKPVRVNAEEDPKTTELYEVEGYPTILLETRDGIYDYTGNRSHESLLQFLRKSLGKESASL